nr:hypothetical protein StreXyl84_57570 [Streptomyces sp. Xyl84]
MLHPLSSTETDSGCARSLSIVIAPLVTALYYRTGVPPKPRSTLTSSQQTTTSRAALPAFPAAPGRSFRRIRGDGHPGVERWWREAADPLGVSGGAVRRGVPAPGTAGRVDG